ncbi:MAG: Gfo/Idh/MocA family oxidoreductase [Clostridiaceae bacterium]|nr:Gfo/Idh/MocA family oxidoreductase [Clostridiaceae bacterium]
MTNGKKYKVAVIGCGYMGYGHLEQIWLLSNTELWSVCDIDPERAREAAERFGATLWSTDYREILADPELDIAIIATWPSTHLEILLVCLEHGIHCICEKPMSDTLESSREFMLAVQSHPETKVLVGHILRHNQTFHKVAELIQSDVIGHPVTMRMVQSHPPTDWERDVTLINETSPIIDCGLHYVDLMRWFTGAEIDSVYLLTARLTEDIPTDKYNYGLLTVRLDDGSAGFFEAGWGHGFRHDNTKEFIGPKGRITVTYMKDRLTHRSSGNLLEIYRADSGETEQISVPYTHKPTDDQLSHLINMIENDVPARPTIEEVYGSFETVWLADINANRRAVCPTPLAELIDIEAT